MKEVLEFLKDYWQLILAAVIFVLSFILQLIKKKPINALIYDICLFSMNAVIFAEKSGLKGLEKLNYAVSIVMSDLANKYPDLEPLKYKDRIVLVIEAILSTPQKKGGSADGEKKTYDEK